MDDCGVVDICRTCGAEDGEVSIFSAAGLELQLPERINAYLPISVTIEDELPLAMCRLCIDRLESCHQLVASCIETNERFKQVTLTQPKLETDLEAKEENQDVDCEDGLLGYEKEEDEQEESIEKRILTLDLNNNCSTGLVAPNVFIIPSLNSQGEKKDDPQSGELITVNSGFLCDGCRIWYKRQDKFMAHQLHCPLIQSFICVICNYKATDKVDLIKHTETHKSFRQKMLSRSLQNMCEVCGRVLSTKMALKLHMRTHSGEKPYVCQVCSKGFAQKNALSYHEKTHYVVKPYKCRFCNKGFNGKLVLQTHERIHTGERPYHCIVCDSGFRCLANLRQHQLIHNTTKRFKCPECIKTFHRPEKVRVHMRTHTGEKPFACPICARRFTQKGDMVKHKAIHNRLSLAELNQNEFTMYQLIV